MKLTNSTKGEPTYTILEISHKILVFILSGWQTCVVRVRIHVACSIGLLPDVLYLCKYLHHNCGHTIHIVNIELEFEWCTTCCLTLTSSTSSSNLTHRAVSFHCQWSPSTFLKESPWYYYDNRNDCGKMLLTIMIMMTKTWSHWAHRTEGGGHELHRLFPPKSPCRQFPQFPQISL